MKQVLDGERVTPRMRGYLMECCDCGLVHRIDFRVLRAGAEDRKGYYTIEERLPRKRYRVELRAYRDEKATKRARRKMKR